MKTMLLAMIAACISYSSYTQNSFEASSIISQYPFLMERFGVKAYRDLEKRYKAADKAKWYKIPDGLLAYLMVDGKKMINGYDKRGNWLYARCSYPAQGLPREIRSRIKTNYLDESITWVDEIQSFETSIYIIQVSDGKKLRFVRIDKEDMQELRVIDIDEPTVK